MSKTQWYRLVAGLAGVIGVSMQIAKDGWGMLLYYTVLSNILVFGFMFYLVYAEFKAGSVNNHRTLLRIKGGVMMCITLTFLVYHFMLGPRVAPADFWNVRNFLVHYIAPLAMIIDTLILDRRQSYDRLDPIKWMSVPIAYLIFAIINGQWLKLAIPGAVDSPYPYYFLNVDKYGVQSVVIYCVVIAIAYALLGYVLMGLKAYIGTKNN